MLQKKKIIKGIVFLAEVEMFYDIFNKEENVVKTKVSRCLSNIHNTHEM